jgi:hypothetical protein
MMDPAAMQQMMQSPLMQQLLSNPELMRNMLQMNPAVREVGRHSSWQQAQLCGAWHILSYDAHGVQHRFTPSNIMHCWHLFKLSFMLQAVASGGPRVF